MSRPIASRGWRCAARLGAVLALLAAGATSATAAISVVGTIVPATSTSAVTSLTLTRSALATLAASDVLLAQLSIRGGTGVTISAVPSGWTLVSRTNQGTSVAQAIYWHAVGPLASEPTTYTWTFTSNRAAIAALAVRGVDTATPVNASAGQATSPASPVISAPGVTSTVNGALHVVMVAVDAGSSSFTPPVGASEQVDIASGAGPNGVTLELSTAAESSAGTLILPWLATYGSSQVGVGHTVALKPGVVAASLHHLELRHGSGTGLTCTPSTLTVAACQDAACSTPYTGGVTATLTATGSGTTTNWPSGAAISIAAGSSSTTDDFQVTTAGSVVLAASGISPAASNATTCNFGSPSCTFTAADSGFIFDVLNHVAEVAQTVSVSAVNKASNSLQCVPAFASVSKAVQFTCSTTNPTSGALPVRVGGRALNSANNTASACDATGQPVTLAFNASGVASTTVQYADVGQMLLSARYTGSGSEAGLVMTGSDSFIAAPASFAFSAITAAPIKAGTGFAATVTARNNAGATTANFGRETSPAAVTLGFTRAQPTGSGASNGVFTGSLGAFSAGVATAGNLVWSEVGLGDLTATLVGASYLGSGLTATGTTGSAGAVGRFIPHHFDVAVTPACTSFSYAAQPFNVSVTAKNGLSTPGTTFNYDGSAATAPNFAKAATLTDAPALGVGSFGSTGALAATLFSAGVATSAVPAYSFTSKLTAPQTLVVRATDTDSVSSAGYAEGSTLLRSGRLRVSNAFGSEKATLAVPVQAQYWSGNTWVANTADSCTTVAAAAVVRAAYLDNKGAASSAWSSSASAIVVSAGAGTLTFGAPSPASTGSLDFALNLGATTTDQSCLATHPASAGGALPWLRSQNGACASGWAADPSARATFGIYTPETRKTIHVREIF